LGVSTARNVSEIMGSDGRGFDPWNQTRWAAWYSSGTLIEPFEIDISVTFEARTTAWEIDVGSVRALAFAHPALFILNANSSVDVNGNGLTIDVRKSYVKAWDLYYYYTHTINIDNDYYNCDAFLLYQTQEADESDAGSRIFNISLKGFNRAISSNHDHRRKVTVQNVVLNRNLWALFPRGRNVTVENCNVNENVSGGLYGEYNSAHWVFNNNIFKDNNTRGTVSYGDIVLDACRNYTITNNQFQPATYNTRDYHIAVSLYRNAGESDDIREFAAKNNLIENNIFDGYNIAIDFAPRMGRVHSLDQSLETRCYTSGNIVRDCDFRNCKIGILLRNNYTTVENNIFSNTEKEIVLHNVFYSMYHNIINQPGCNVWLWSVESDYTAYSQYLPYGNGAGEQIQPNEKFYHVICKNPMPVFHNFQNTELLVSDTLLVPAECDLDSSMIIDFNDLQLLVSDWLSSGTSIQFTNQNTNIDLLNNVNFADFANCAKSWFIENERSDVFSVGGRPIDIAVGDIAVYESGNEIAVIWDTPVSNIGGTNYYTIIIYDQNGLELDRCGRSSDKWGKIAAGNFLPDTGWIKENANYEIAAVHSQPDSNGKYPVYIFRKGSQEPAVIIAQDNAIGILAITAGNFKTDGDEYDEIALKLQNSDRIQFMKPSDASWTRYTLNVQTNITSMAAGEFDGIKSNGDEIAAVIPSVSPVYLYKADATTHYEQTANCGKSWSLVAGGNFNSDSRRDEVAVVTANAENGIYKIYYFTAQSSSTTPLKITELENFVIPPISLEAGKFNVENPLSAYEKLENVTYAQLIQDITSWGEHIAVLPSDKKEYSIPLFWIATNPQDSNKSHYRTVPLLR